MNTNNEKKLTDKAFARAIISSLIGIFVCLICICTATWAWFTDSVEYLGSTLKAGECMLEVKVTDENGDELQSIESGVVLDANETYLVTLTLPKDSTSGYCMIASEDKNYYSDFVLRHSNQEPTVLTFYVSVQSTQTVKFIKRWGIYSGEPNVVENATLVLPTIDINE